MALLITTKIYKKRKLKVMFVVFHIALISVSFKSLSPCLQEITPSTQNQQRPATGGAEQSFCSSSSSNYTGVRKLTCVLLPPIIFAVFGNREKLEGGTAC